MIAWILEPLRLLARAFVVDESPRQLAWGATLGMILGLLPKDNLIAVSLGVLLFALRVNLGIGIVTAFIVGTLAPLVDPFAHKIGLSLLTDEAMQATFANWYHWPLVPWSGLNNTVVLGQLVIGLYLAYPVLWASQRLFERIQPGIASRIRRYRVTRWLTGANIGSQLGYSE